MTNASSKAMYAGMPSLPLRQSFWKIFLILAALFLSDTAYSQTVYITRTGEKYHDDGCRYLSRSKIKTTLQDAKENGYTACSVCKPSTKVTTNQPTITTTPAPPAKKATSTQCTATTKSNARCSRMTTNANGRCWQHQ